MRSITLSSPFSELALPNRTFCEDGKVRSVPFITAATGHMWLFSTWNVGCVTEVLKFSFYSV